MVFQCINIRQVPWEVLKTAASASVFNISHGTWRMLMHEKPCLIPIVSNDLLADRKRPRSDCMDTQADLGLPCPHIPRRHGSYYLKYCETNFHTCPPPRPTKKKKKKKKKINKPILAQLSRRLRMSYCDHLPSIV